MTIQDCVQDAAQAVLLAATAPDHHSRAAYTGRIIQKEHVTIISDDGTAFEKEVSFTISWDSIVKILDLIRERAKKVSRAK